MINPISSAHSSERAAQSTPPKPEHPAPAPAPAPQQTVKSGTVSRDQVTLKSGGQIDSDNK